MARRGIVLLSGDSGAKPFVDDFLDEVAPEEGEAVCVFSAHTCIATLSLPVQRRLLVIDGAPVDVMAGALIEAAQLVDPGLPILFVRYGWSGPAVDNGRVCVHPGPLVSSGCAAALVSLLRSPA